MVRSNSILSFITWLAIVLIDDSSSSGKPFQTSVSNGVLTNPSSIDLNNPAFGLKPQQRADYYPPSRRPLTVGELEDPDDATFDYFPLDSVTDDDSLVVDSAALTLPRGGAQDKNPPSANARPELLARVDNKADRTLERMPSHCTIMNFNEQHEMLNHRARFVHNLFQPNSRYHGLIRGMLEPLVLDFPFQKLFQLKLPIIGGYQANVKIYDARVFNFVPSKVEVRPVEGFNQKLDVEVEFPTLQLEYYYDVVFRQRFFGQKSEVYRSKLHLSAGVLNPKLKVRMNVACMECQGGYLSKLRQYFGYAAHVGKGLLTGGWDGMKKASLIALYDADVEKIDVSYERGNVQDVRITELPKTRHQDPDEMERQVPGVSDTLKKAANFLYNGLLKQDLSQGIARDWLRDSNKALNKMRPHFFKSFLENRETDSDDE